MKKKVSDFDEFFVATVLADLFDSTGSNNPDFVAHAIIEGLIENGLLQQEDLENDDLKVA